MKDTRSWLVASSSSAKPDVPQSLSTGAEGVHQDADLSGARPVVLPSIHKRPRSTPWLQTRKSVKLFAEARSSKGRVQISCAIAVGG
ncbi:hypothetical protein GN244_ATG03201 [Phytophthora infestans]|uniref:Uncharacterized protein n=1 Tax=Phytophthora infestans TaxID=4787 RepID=A0A833T014_PHYIN|nr:hypothetical protein GN244_ATG03201 [Phytophthora infestans]